MILVTVGTEIEKKKKKKRRKKEEEWMKQLEQTFLMIFVTAAPEIELGGLAVRKCRERV